MICRDITKDIVQELKGLPQGWVFYALKSDTKYLYAGIGQRVGRKLYGYWLQSREDRLLAELFEQAQTLEYREMPDSMSAFILLKSFVMDHYPIYQHRIYPWADYVYLAMDSHRFPFISIQQFSNDDWQYIGPFQSRFFLVDLLDTLSRIVKLPFCETGTFPCYKFEKEICRGWCLALSTSKETELEHDLDKLDILLKETFLRPENGILEMVQKERDSYFEALEFAKADLLDDEIALLSDYREWLKFLYAAKDLNWEEGDLRIEQGQLAQAKVNGRIYEFPIDRAEYRENEKLAIPLSITDEMKIIYDYIKERANA